MDIRTGGNNTYFPIVALDRSTLQDTPNRVSSILIVWMMGSNLISDDMDRREHLIGAITMGRDKKHRSS